MRKTDIRQNSKVTRLNLVNRVTTLLLSTCILFDFFLAAMMTGLKNNLPSVMFVSNLMYDQQYLRADRPAPTRGQRQGERARRRPTAAPSWADEPASSAQLAAAAEVEVAEAETAAVAEAETAAVEAAEAVAAAAEAAGRAWIAPAAETASAAAASAAAAAFPLAAAASSGRRQRGPARQEAVGRTSPDAPWPSAYRDARAAAAVVEAAEAECQMGQKYMRNWG